MTQSDKDRAGGIWVLRFCAVVHYFCCLSFPSQIKSLSSNQEIAFFSLFPSQQLQHRLERSSVHRVRGLPRMCERNVRKAVGVQVQRGLGRSVLQPGPQLLHQPQALPERGHLLQHRPGIIHLQLPARIYGHRLRDPHFGLREESLHQRGHVP